MNLTSIFFCLFFFLFYYLFIYLATLLTIDCKGTSRINKSGRLVKMLLSSQSQVKKVRDDGD